MYYMKFDSRIGEITLLGTEKGLSRLHIKTDLRGDLDLTEHIENESLFRTVKEQLLLYFEGKLEKFDVNLDVEGTDFQKLVWNHLKAIPYGKTCSYKDIAIAMKKPTASRAVGMANGKNPVPIIVPCHRVIGSNKKLTGFAFGLEVKKALLTIESHG